MIALGTSVSAIGVAGCTGDETDGSGQADTGSPEETTDSTEQTETDGQNDTTSSTETTSPTHDFKSPPYDNIETEEGPSSTTVSGRIVLDAGQYAQYNFELEESTQFHIIGSNEGQGTMDLFLLSPESELSTYMEGESSDFSGGFTETDFESVDRSTEISSGDYFLVFDNSAVYGAEPQGEVAFEFEMVLGDPSPSQPKIREVTDNMGHTFNFSDDSWAQVRVDDEIIVSDDTVVELCVTEVAAESDDEISYSYTFLEDRDHPDNPEETELSDNCWEWNMRRNDYQSQWGYRIWVSNDDDIYYHNNSNETDYAVDIYYTNLRLAD